MPALSLLSWISERRSVREDLSYQWRVGRHGELLVAIAADEQIECGRA